MKADAILITTDVIARERDRMAEAEDLASDLTRSSGMVLLVAEGVRAICKDSCPGDWVGEAMVYAAGHAHDIAERMAALLRNEPCRWNAGQTDAERNAIDAPEDQP